MIVSPSTVNGVIKPSDSSLTITNKFDTTGITTDKEPPYVVKNAGVEFNKVNDDGTISLTGTSWTRLAGGWAKDKAFPLGAHMILTSKIQPSMKILKKSQSNQRHQGVHKALHALKMVQFGQFQLPTTL